MYEALIAQFSTHCVIVGKNGKDGVGLGTEKENVYKFLGKPTVEAVANSDIAKTYEANLVMIYKDMHLVLFFDNANRVFKITINSYRK